MENVKAEQMVEIKIGDDIASYYRYHFRAEHCILLFMYWYMYSSAIHLIFHPGGEILVRKEYDLEFRRTLWSLDISYTGDTL